MRHAWLFVSLSFAACTDRTVHDLEPMPETVELKDIPLGFNRNLDLLFVIDDSPSMLDKQQNLRANFPNFMNVLDTGWGRPDLHIGVVSTDLGARGTDDAQGGAGIPGCSGNGKGGVLQKGRATTELDGTFISDIQSGAGRTQNYTGELHDVFGKMASLGADGCGFEQPLEAMKRALDNNPANAGFLREGAYLGVVFIVDEDDCSFRHGGDMLAGDSAALGPRQSFRCTQFGVTCDDGGATPDAMATPGAKSTCHPATGSALLPDVGSYADFLKGLKPDDPAMVLVAGIMGEPAPIEVELRAPTGSATAIPALAHSCNYAGVPSADNPSGIEVADPPVRLASFLDEFPHRSQPESICQQDLSGGLLQVAHLFKMTLGLPCIEARIKDIDPVTEGLQYECSASWVLPDAAEQLLPNCNADGTNQPCFRLVENESCGSGGGVIGLEFRVESLYLPPDGTHETLQCVTDPVPPNR